MATVNKNFKIKSGLVVEGTTGTINGEDILTKSEADIDYIIDQVGGSGESTNTPNTLVLRDANGDFAAGNVTVNELTISGAGSITNPDGDGDIRIQTLGAGDFDVYADDVYISAGDDFRVEADDVLRLTSLSGSIHLEAANAYFGTDGDAADRIATEGYVTDAIGNIDLTFNSDEITEGTTNLYYTDARVDSHLSGGDGITYSAGTISADLGTGLEITGGQIVVDRTETDTWYDANGAAADVATDLSTHETATTGIHGVTGNIVGTSDTQTLSNKTIDGNLDFGVDGSYINDNEGDLTVYSAQDLYITSDGGDIVLDPDMNVYIGSATAGNQVATHSYVDNAVSGLSWKTAVNLLSTTNVDISGDLVGTVIDGHAALDTNDGGYRLLLTGQTTDSENGIYVLTVDGSTLVAARSADTDAYDELIGAAVYVMEGTQYGSTSWVQGNHYITDFSGQDWTQFSGQGSVTAGDGIVVDGLEVSVDFTVVAEVQDLTDGLALKQDVLTAGDNIDISGATISVTGLDSADISDFNTAALSATASAYDAAGSAASAQEAAEDYADGLAVNYDAAGSAATAESNANSYTDTAIGNLDTDDIDEGSSNQYFTDSRAKDSAADLLTNATLTNITITGTGAGLTITAESGVADATTDDLAEGEENLYFTDERAIDAVSNADIYPNAVIIDNVAKQVATSTLRATAGTHVGVAFAKADYRSAEFLVKVAYGDHTEISKVLLTLDVNDNISITEYGIIGTNGSGMTVSAGISGTDVQLLVTTANNDTTVTVVGTLLI